MTTLIRTRFAAMGIEDGRDVLLGHSPNRVMPGRLIERIREADKILSGLHPETIDLINELYGVIVTGGRLHRANSLTAETVKTLENTYRDVRIALAAEIARFCDEADIDFHALRSAVNIRSGRTDGASTDPTAVPTGGLLVPTVGVGGHCLPKDGILLLWRLIEAGVDVSRSLILQARRINDASPAAAAVRIERLFGNLHNTSVTLLGAAYRPGAADTRNSPALALGRILKSKCRAFTLHDPFVRPEDPRLTEAGVAESFTADIGAALKTAEIIVIGTAHQEYRSEGIGEAVGPSARAVFDAAHLFTRGEFASRPQVYEGVGKGRREPTSEFIEDAVQWLRAVELGIANELYGLINFLNDHFGGKDGGVDFEIVRTLAATCSTGCAIAAPGFVGDIPAFRGFLPSLPVLAARASGIRP
jgi:UDP-N-acetyl-D-mannosaminuronic acid dehydrogenase